MDNSTMWDPIMQAMFPGPSGVPADKRAGTRVGTRVVSAEDRPESAGYDRFAYLVKLLADRGYDEARIREDCPLLVHDVLFSSFLCRAEEDLAGEPGRDRAPARGRPVPVRERSRRTAASAPATAVRTRT